MLWKTIAILFIIISVIEAAILVYIFDVGNKIIENENECSVNICEGYQSYYYDYYGDTCYCYEDGEIAKQRYLS